MYQDVLAARFTVLGTLGEGAMGTLLRVRDSHWGGREVALKRISALGATTAAMRFAFREEYRAMVKLQHPNTLVVYDFGHFEDDSPFFTMEIVDGQDLASLIADGDLPLGRCLQILLQLAQVLAFMHSRLYVHRDVKSQNVRVMPDGAIKLLDFGLNTRLGSHCRGGVVTGSPAYMPPEAIVGGVIDASSDLYSLGCLAYEMLTGAPPFRGTVAEVLRAHLHAEPTPLAAQRPDVPAQLQRLITRLMSKEPRLRYRSGADLAADLALMVGGEGRLLSLEQKRSYLVSSELVGREAELATCQAMLAAAAGGQGQAVFIAAEAGVGKSRLLQELLVQAKLDGVTVMHAACREFGTDAFEPFANALRAFVGGDEAPVAGEEALLAIFGDARSGDLRHSEEHIAHAVAAALSRIGARGALMLVLDDLQWADAASMRVLDHCVRALTAQPLLIVGAFRREELPADATPWTAVVDGAARYLHLRPFEPTQVASLLLALLGDCRIAPELVGELASATGGNAFFISEVLRSWIEEGTLILHEGQWLLPAAIDMAALPSSISTTVERRLARLPVDAFALARVAAVLGAVSERSWLAEASAFEEAIFFTALDALVEHQFLRLEGQGYGFTHDRVRETLYQGLAGPQRVALHERCGELLERVAGETGLTRAAELAHHFERAGDQARAYRYARQAGDEALARGVMSGALAFWRRADDALAAADLPNKVPHQVALWEAIGYHGMERAPRQAIDALERLIALLRREGERSSDSEALPAPRAPFDEGDRSFVCHALLAAAYGIAGEPTKGDAHAAQAAVIFGAGGEERLGAVLEFARGVNYLPFGRIDEMIAEAQRARARLFDRDLSGRPLAMLARMGTARLLCCSAYQGYRVDEEMLSYALWAADRNGAHGYYNMLRHPWALYQAWSGRLTAAMEYVDWAAQNSRRIGAPPYQWALYLRPFVLQQQGELAGAIALIERAYDYPHLRLDGTVHALLQVLHGHALLDLGDLAAARERFDTADAAAREHHLGVALMRAMLGRCQLASATGDAPGARWLASEVVALATEGPMRNPLHAAIACRMLGELDLASGSPGTALSHLDRAQAVVADPAIDNLLEQAHLLRARAVFHGARGARALAVQSLQQARRLYLSLDLRAAAHDADERLLALSGPPPEQGALPLTRIWMAPDLRGG